MIMRINGYFLWSEDGIFRDAQVPQCNCHGKRCEQKGKLKLESDLRQKRKSDSILESSLRRKPEAMKETKEDSGLWVKLPKF